MNYCKSQIDFNGALLPVLLGINLATGQIQEVLFTSANLIDLYRAQGFFLMWGNNDIGRSIGIRLQRRLHAEVSRYDVVHIGNAPDSPMTSAEFKLSWANFIRLKLNHQYYLQPNR